MLLAGNKLRGHKLASYQILTSPPPKKDYLTSHHVSSSPKYIIFQHVSFKYKKEKDGRSTQPKVQTAGLIYLPGNFHSLFLLEISVRHYPANPCYPEARH